MNENRTEKKMRKFYFVDYENVSRAGLKGIDELGKKDKVYIFYSSYANSLSFNEYESLMKTKAEVVCYEVSTVGKNALDFQLSSFIGYVVGQNDNAVFYIISKDNGYLNVVNFWRTKNIRIQMLNNIEMTPKNVNVKKSQIAELLAETELELTEEDILTVRDIMRGCIKENAAPINKVKSAINTELCRKFGNNSTKIIYNAIKPLIE